MCKVQSFMYLTILTCICICILSTTTNAFPNNKNETDNNKTDANENMTNAKETEEMLSVYAAKTKIRIEMKKKLSKMSPIEKQRQTNEVISRFLKHPIFTYSHQVAVYISTDYEMPTIDIIKRIFESGKRCFIPKVQKNGTMTMVRVRSMEDLRNLPKTKLNFTQPADDDIREDIMDIGGLDLIVVPGLAFTDSGKRLGRGKGYYDEFLTEYDKKFPRNVLLSVALVYNEQICDDLPTTPKDQDIYFVDQAKY